MFFLKNLTFNFALFVSLIVHLFLFSLFYIDSFKYFIYKPKQTKIAFIHDNAFLFQESKLYKLSKDIISDISKLIPGKKNISSEDNKTFVDRFDFLKNKEILKYKNQEKKINENYKKPEIKINSQRKVLRMYYPEYPLWAKKLRLESEVKVKIKINKHGFIEDIVFDKMSINPELDAIALRAIRKWVFQPVLTEKESAQWASVVLKFKLD